MQTTAGSGNQSEPTDERLLHDYVTSQDPGAFAAIVRRHGTMVFGVCRRILRREQDAEDAFQATFLVLMRRARSLAKPKLLGNWLYGVAYRTASKIRSTDSRQRIREAPMVDLPAPDADDEVIWRDLRSVLDDELERLPQRYRTPMVLFYLEGKSAEEVASVLGCPKGTILSQLARARERLRGRLARRDLALSTGVLATLLARTALSEGAVPESLLHWSMRAQSPLAALPGTEAGISAQARTVAQQVLKDMAWRRLRILGALILAGSLGIGVGIMGYRTLTASPAVVEQPDSALDAQRMQGTWQVVAVVSNGRLLSREQFPFTRMRIQYETIVHDGGRHILEATFRLDAAQHPKTMDMVAKGYHNETYPAIYELDGDTLRICRPDSEVRPTEFTSEEGSKKLLITAKRSGP